MTARYSFTPIMRVCACGVRYAYIDAEDLDGCPDCRNRPAKK